MPTLKGTVTRDNAANSWIFVTPDTIRSGVFSNTEILSLTESRDAVANLPGRINTTVQFLDDLTCVTLIEFDSYSNANTAYNMIVNPEPGSTMYTRKQIMETKRAQSGANYQAVWEIIE